MKKTFVITGTILSSLFVSTSAMAATPHKVHEGDTLYRISKKYNTSVEELKTINHLTSNLIVPGQVIKIEKEDDKTYTVKPGDSLSKIAKTHKTTVNKLVQLNPDISNPNLIVVGQNIHLAGTSKSNTTVSTSSSSSKQSVSHGSYTVKLGDTLYRIARAQNTTVDVLLSLNPHIKDENKIQVGQVVKVSGAVVNTSKNKPSSTTSTTNKTNKQVKKNTQSTPSSSNTITKEEAKTVQSSANEITKTSSTETKTTATKQTTETNQSQSNLADKVIAAGAKYLGAPYSYGASINTTSKFDCSSFTLRAFQEGAGISLPRTSRAQASAGTTVSLNLLQKGDLLFFDTDKDGVINHVGIYTGNGQMINASTSHGVSYASLDNTYWKPLLVKAVRVLN
ncbi:LysM peptidoglycan-binding domain-containing protein [Bacillus mexicanus]|uniref:C40 family peptidase n=1 Tax=Bacillus mexicanus TaxID=2834415 RepID=UPI003D209A81